MRLPADVKSFIEVESRENGSSQNSEIVRAIRSAMKIKGATEGATSSRHVTPNL
ncbi:Arc family DNA-binding protein [Aliihoeflea sp. 2WW]|uniref:Arc family DNA-binding protein n=1 Tax=Aliihoeflea sp. 2WW TaxID=1381123 RepID=UPI00244E2C65|nr:Arc family DNA-binding protein [Aliihoeflea sp. 2WW]